VFRVYCGEVGQVSPAEAQIHIAGANAAGEVYFGKKWAECPKGKG